MIPNITTGRVANRLDFMGKNFTVDAACASSLIAAELGVQGLVSGKDDMVLIGGVHVFTNVPFLQVFAAMRALSPTAVIRPFDADCDGTLPGEGVGILVLKRLEDAEKAGDRIYAVIKGIGSSSDGKAKSVTAPRVEGEELALRRAYEASGISPQSIELIEAHGTGTPVGDAAEAESLRRVFGSKDAGPPSCAVGSVKSMIGHAMPAAGAAGIIKTALALYHKVIPPTLNCRKALPAFQGPDSRFYVSAETRPWIHGRTAGPRRAGVNAFGFGGVNAHVVLEEYTPAADAVEQPTLMRNWDSELVVVEAATRPALHDAVTRLSQYVEAAPWATLRDVAYSRNVALTAAPFRVSVIAASIADLKQKLDRIAQRLSDPACKQIKDSAGIYYFEDTPLRRGKLALLFPGEGSQYLNMLADLCIHFPEVRECFDTADQMVEHQKDRYAPSADIFPPPFASPEEEQAAERRLWQIQRATEAVLTADGAVFTLLQKLGLKPDMIAGHSAGEWVAMAASGILDTGEFLGGMHRLDHMYRKLADDASIPTMAMLAVGAGPEKVAKLVAEIDCIVHVANYNCPNQVVIVAEPQDAGRVVAQIQSRGIFVETLPYDRGYHTHAFTHVCEPLRQYFSSMTMRAPQIPVYCCTTARCLPDDAEQILEHAANTFARPLLFQQTIEAMYADGARIFVEAGPRGNLTAFVDDILRGRPHLALAIDQYRRPALTTLNNTLGALAALHVPLDLTPLYSRRSPRTLSWDPQQDRPESWDSAPGTIQVPLGSPRLEVPAPLRVPDTAGSQQAGVRFPSETPEFPTVTFGDTGLLQAAEVQHARAAAGGHDNGHGDGHAPSNGNGNGHRSSVQSSHSPVQPSHSAARLAESHLQLMESFLETEEAVMRAFLQNGALGARGGDSRVLPMAAQSLDVLNSLDTDLMLPAYSDADSFDEGEAIHPGPPPPERAVPGPVAQSTKSTRAESPDPGTAVNAVVAAPIISPISIGDALLRIVGERTGYPVEMLGLDLDMEADLGIDSIKRIEILSALQQLGDEQRLRDTTAMEEVAKLKTLRQVLNFLEREVDPGPDGHQVSPKKAPGAPVSALTAGGRTLSHTPGQEVVVVCDILPEEHLYLVDHCFDPVGSDWDPDRQGLYFVPMTVSVALMAEVAAILGPASKVVGAKNIQASKWIGVEKGGPKITIAVTARRSDDQHVFVSIAHHQPDRQPGAPTEALAEGTIVLAPDYPAAPEEEAFELVNARTPQSTGPGLYATRRMFHGPRFQGIASLDAMGDDGLLAQLDTLPRHNLIRSNPDPAFHLDPCLLDAAGQLVGYWPIEYCQEGFVLFPIRIQELKLFRPPLPPGQRSTCQMRIKSLSHHQLKADLDVIAPDGKVWMRILGWEDWRFYWPKGFYEFWRFPNKGENGTHLDFRLPEGWPDVECRKLDPFGEIDKSMWENLWAHIILSQRELTEYRSIEDRGSRASWICERAVTKDTVRMWVRSQAGRELYPADVEISNGDGRLTVAGPWQHEVQVPDVSIARHGALTVAAAGRCGLGVEIEPVVPGSIGSESGLLSPPELALLPDNGPQRDEWLARACCAKKAAAKALGIPVEDSGRVKDLVISSLDVERGEVNVVRRSAKGQDQPLEMVIPSVRDGDNIIALAVTRS